VLAGLERPDAGAVRIAGTDVTGVPARERGIGFVFQHYAAFRHLTVAENVGFALTVRRRPRAEVRARVEELLALVRLDGLAGRYPSQLSGGQRQRMVLARALAAEPRVLLLDEPFGALDAAIRAELRDWLRRLHEQVPVTTIVVTHDQDEALELADQIVVVNRGRVEQAGTPAELYDRPATPFVMTFLGTSTRLAGAWHRPHEIDLIQPAATGTGPVGTVSRVTPLPTHVRVDVDVADHDGAVVVHLPRGGGDAGLVPGRTVRLAARRPGRFAEVPDAGT
jgi:sulfate transport system ATP-binding protein